MRVLMLTQWFQPEPFFKGLPLAKALKERGHSVEVLTGFPNYPGGSVYSGYRVQPWQREVLDGVPVLRVALYPSHDSSSSRRILNYLSFAVASLAGGMLGVQRPDVVWVYNLVTLAPCFSLLRQRYGCPAVLDVQDLWPESVSASGMLGGYSDFGVMRSLSNWGYQAADLVVAQSPGMRAALIERGLKAECVELQYNWTEETDALAGEPDRQLLSELGLQDTFNIVFAGTMGRVQRLDVVLDAARLLMCSAPAMRFLLVGGGVTVEELKHKAQALGLTNVVFLPRQPRSEMGRILSSAHVGLVHLRNDPLFRITIPSKTQAYFREGLPVLMAVEGDARAIVETAGAGIGCAPESPESLASAAIELSRLSPEELRKMGARGREFYRREMSFDVGVDRLEGFLKRVVNRNA